MNKKGFTLAEVLVTLTIIGVVAALTIPGLLQSTNQSELKVGLKKAVGVLNQAVLLSIATDSANAQTCTSCNTKAGLAQFFMNRLNVISSNTTATDPYFYTADGMRFDFTKITTCTDAITTNPSGTTCVVQVDVNGDKGPGTLSTGNSTSAYSFKDKYNLIVRANSVLPASNGTDDASLVALQQ